MPRPNLTNARLAFAFFLASIATESAVLTPGDFAAVARRHRFAPIASPAAFVAALSAECAVKSDGNHAPIGLI